MSAKTITKVYDSLQELRSLIIAQSAEFIDINEASLYLKLKKSYLYNLVYRNQIPFYKPNGKKIYFNKLELSNWITDSKIKTIKEYAEELTAKKNTSFALLDK